MEGSAKPPNLICIGMEKSGTTFLNAVFEHSDSVLTPSKKELFYYNIHYKDGIDWYLSWYDFSTKPSAKYACDITPSYFRNQQVIGRIKQTAPDAKLVILVRHPVTRAYSHYVHRLRHVALTLEDYSASFFDVLAGDVGKHDVFPLYHEQLAPWLDHFPRDNILVLGYESDLFHPEAVSEKLHNFLGVDDLDFARFSQDRINDGLMPKFYYGGTKGRTFFLDSKEYVVPAKALLLAHAKGDRVWGDVDPSVAMNNIEASKNWTRHLSATDVKQVFDQYYAQDAQAFAEAFSFDIGPWSESRSITYRRATPDSNALGEVSESVDAPASSDD